MTGAIVGARTVAQAEGVMMEAELILYDADIAEIEAGSAGT